MDYGEKLNVNILAATDLIEIIYGVASLDNLMEISYGIAWKPYTK